MTTRGTVVALTAEQQVARLLYLAGRKPLAALDPHVLEALPAPSELARAGYEGEVIAAAVRMERAGNLEEARGYVVAFADQVWCPAIYYLLEEHNGGKSPLAPDPADRWSNPGSTFVNRTCDCSGGQSWAHGFDRYQPKRMAASIGYGGWFNTDSKILDARGPRSCFEPLDRPEPGCIIVCMSGSRGHRIGHEGGVVAYNGVEWDPRARECWDLIDVVDVAALGAGVRANTKRTGRGWYDTNAMFLRPIMTP